jgi:exopolyphosphatase/guanosine-5'-triphosphate,3'-diphosphate pyrophosphatase
LKVAVVDLGTNSARLLLATVAGGHVDDVARETTVTRLGAGVDRRRRLDAAAAERTRACLAGYAAQVAGFAPEARLLVATSVLRDAADGAAFLERLAVDFGLPWRILSGEQEAALSFAGAVSGQAATGRTGGPGDRGAGSRRPRPGSAGAPPGRPATVVIDIGGGSLELAVGTPSEPGAPHATAPPSEPGARNAPAPLAPAMPPAAAPSFVCSLDVGVVRLTERFFASDPPDDAEWRAAQGFARSTLAAAVPPHVRAAVGQGIGLAGTFTTLVAHKLALPRYDRTLVHGHELTVADLDGALGALRQMTSAARGRLPGIQPGREDVILAGVLLAREVCRLFDLAAVRVSEADLLDGVALSLAVD